MMVKQHFTESLQRVEADKSLKDVLEMQIGRSRRENGEPLKLRTRDERLSPK